MILLWSFTNIVFLWGSDVQGACHLRT